MTDREKVLTSGLVLLGLVVVGLFGAVLTNVQQNEKYKAILDVSCRRAISQSQCDSGMKLLMDMSPEEIKRYGSFGF